MGPGRQVAVSWRPLEPERGRDPRPVGEALDAVSRGLGGPGVEAARALLGRWPELVGEALAAHTQPLSLVDGTLVLGVDDPVWQAQLRWLEADLLGRLQGSLGGDGVRRVVVRVLRR